MLEDTPNKMMNSEDVKKKGAVVEGQEYSFPDVYGDGQSVVIVAKSLEEANAKLADLLKAKQ